MKNIYMREMRHIVANHAIKNQSTAYCIRSKSISFKIVRKLIRHNWIECKSTDGPFVFVRPSRKMIALFGNS
jgi:hypothetical protein